MSHHAPRPEDRLLTRREALCRGGMGFGALALSSLMSEAGLLAPASAAEPNALTPLAPRKPQFAPKAKRVVHLFMNGGPSHVDTFDPKPMLSRYHGKPVPSSRPTERKTGAAFGSPFRFKKYGQSGLEVSEIFSHVGECADDLCVIRSMTADFPNHEPSLMMMNTGDNVMVRPSMGSWVTYGMGTLNQNLPGFIVLCPGGYPIKESENWRSAFLPGVYQGTFIDSQHTEIEKLIEHIRNTTSSVKEQRQQLDLIQE